MEAERTVGWDLGVKLNEGWRGQGGAVEEGTFGEAGGRKAGGQVGEVSVTKSVQ